MLITLTHAEKQVQQGAVVVVTDLSHIDPFPLILLLKEHTHKNFFSKKKDVDFFQHLFPSKDMLVEVKLQLLISHVDAELLKRVLAKVLEPENIQDPNVQLTGS